MTKQETMKILSIFKVTYPNFYKNTDDVEVAVNIWAMMLEDDNYKLVLEAVKSLMCTLKYPPTIADVKEKINLITAPTEMTELEAWGKVRKAIGYYNCQERFDNLEPTLQKLVGNPNQLREWSLLEQEQVNTVIQSNFMRSYKARVSQDKQLKMLPNSTKDFMLEFSEKFKMIEG